MNGISLTRVCFAYLQIHLIKPLTLLEKHLRMFEVFTVDKEQYLSTT